jgi:AraC-like DNA-binding protein
MTYPTATDIQPLLKTLVQSLKPYVKKKNIRLYLTCNENEIRLDYFESELLSQLTKFISSILDYMPENSALYLNAVVLKKEDVDYLSLKIRNTGINLKMVTAIIKTSSLPVILFSSGSNETTFEVSYPLKPATDVPIAIKKSSINYNSVIKGIQTLFSKLNDPIARLSESKPREAAFLVNINNCISENISDERFDANALSNAMAMSRAQLLRRLKALTGNSPGFYIKTIRLEKAKELLETGLSVSEAAFKTGFGTPSNFTKVFTEKYGMTPSQFRRINSYATKK